MSGGGDEDPVEADYHREEHREQKGMDYKQTDPKFRSNILSRVFDDNRSVGSDKSGKTLLDQLFFENEGSKVKYPLCDNSRGFWITEQNPNDYKLSEHEKCNIETLNQVLRHKIVFIQPLEQLVEPHQCIDTGESTQSVMTTVVGTL